MIKRSGYYPEVIKTQFNKPLAMTEKGLEDFNNSAKGQIYKKTYEEGEVKLKDHNRITGEYR